MLSESLPVSHGQLLPEDSATRPRELPFSSWTDRWCFPPLDLLFFLFFNRRQRGVNSCESAYNCITMYNCIYINIYTYIGKLWSREILPDFRFAWEHYNSDILLHMLQNNAFCAVGISGGPLQPTFSWVDDPEPSIASRLTPTFSSAAT